MCNVTGDINVFARVKIDRLQINAENVTVHRGAELNGISKLDVLPRKSFMVTGLATADDMTVDGESCIAIHGGIINGSESFNSKASLTVALFGGVLAGNQIMNRAGLYINLFGVCCGWHTVDDSLSSLEFGNIYLPYIDMRENRSVYDLICKYVNSLKDLATLDTNQLYAQLSKLMPQSTDEVWQFVASRPGVFRTALNTISTPASLIFSFSFQAVSLIKQMLKLHNAYDWYAPGALKDMSSRELMMLLLELKGLMVAGRALHKSASNGFTHKTSRLTPAQAALDIAAFALPSHQSNSILTANAPIVSVSFTDTRQNWASASSGNTVAWNVYEESLFGQYARGNTIAYSATYSTGGTRVHNNKVVARSLTVEADNLEYSGAVQDVGTCTLDVKNMPVDTAEAVLHGEGKFANMHVRDKIAVKTAAPGDATIRPSERGPTVGLSLTAPGTISVPENLDVQELELTSTEGNIVQTGNIQAQENVVFSAAQSIDKPSVVTESAHGSVLMHAGGIVDNSNGGQVLAFNGVARVTGGEVDNQSSEHTNRSLISGRETFVDGKTGNVVNRGSTIHGSKYVQVYAAKSIILHPLETKKWVEHDYATTFHPSEITGGSGTEYSHGRGAVVFAEDILDIYASTIGSTAETFVRGDQFVKIWTASNVYKSEDAKWKSGLFNTIYWTAENVVWGTATIYGVTMEICSPEGQILLHGANTLTQNGATIWSKGEHVNEPATAVLKSCEKKVKSKGLFGTKPKEDETTTEHVATFETVSGDIQIISREAGIKSAGAIYVASPHHQSRLIFKAAGDICVNPAVVDHSSIQRVKGGLSVSIAGQTLFGEDSNPTWVDRLTAVDQTVASFHDITQSRNPLDALINGYSAISGAARWANSIAQKGLFGALSEAVGLTVGITNSKTVYKYQTLAGGSIHCFTFVIMDSEFGNVDLGADVANVYKLYIHANTFRAHGTELKSSLEHTSQTVSTTFGFQGTDVGASASRSKAEASHFTQQHIDVEVLEVFANLMELFGAEVVCNVFLGKVGTLHTSELIGTTRHSQQSISVNSSGSVGLSFGHGTDQTVDAVGVLRVLSQGGMQATVNDLVETGKLGVIYDNNSPIEMPGTNRTNHSIHLKHSSSNISAGFNPLAMGNEDSGHTMRFGLDTHHKVDVLDKDGLRTVKDEGHRFTAVQFVPPGKPQVELPSESDINHARPNPEGLTATEMCVANESDAFIDDNNQFAADGVTDDWLPKPQIFQETSETDSNTRKFSTTTTDHVTDDCNSTEPAHVSRRQTVMYDQKSKNTKTNPVPESMTPEQWKANYDCDLTERNVMVLFASNQLLPGDYAYVKAGIDSAISESVERGDELTFGLVRKAKNAVVGYFENDARIRERIAARDGRAPDVTSMTYASPVIAEAALTFVPDTPAQVVAASVIPVVVEIAAARVIWMYHEYRVAKTFAQLKLPINTEKLTKGQIVEYLQNVDKVPMRQLTKDIERLGFELLEQRPKNGIYKFSHVKNHLRESGNAKANLDSSKVILELHNDTISGPHMHITDTNGNVYDKYLSNLTAKLRQENPGLVEKQIRNKVKQMPEAHITIKEFVELNVRLSYE